MSLNIDNILNGTPDKRIYTAYQNFLSNYNENGSKDFKSIYESENLSDIVNNSFYIMKDPYEGVKFYENVILNPAYCLFNHYEGELEKVHHMIESARKAGIPSNQLDLYLALESKLTNLCKDTRGVRIITEYTKNKIDEDFEDNLSNAIYEYATKGNERKVVNVLESMRDHRGVLFTYAPFVCENDGMDYYVNSLISEATDIAYESADTYNILESTVMMNRLDTDNYYKNALRHLHNGDSRLIINTYMKESSSDILDQALGETMEEGNMIFHSTVESAFVDILNDTDNYVAESENNEIMTETSKITKFAMDTVFDLMNTESAQSFGSFKSSGYPLYEFFTSEKNITDIDDAVGKLGNVISNYENDKIDFFEGVDEDDDGMDTVNQEVDGAASSTNNSNASSNNRNNVPVRAQSGNAINRVQVGAQDLQAKQMGFLGKVKKFGSDVINAGRAIIGLPLNFMKAIKSEVDKLDAMDDRRRKEYMLRPGFRKKIFKNLKLSILYGTAASTNLALLPITMVLRSFSKEKDLRIRNDLIEDLKTEISICEEKINDAADDKKKKYELMRIRDRLKKELRRVEINSRYI